jgi:hypothetical protein
MMNARTVAMVVGGIVCLTRGVNGQSVSQYRNFALGSDMVSVSALAGIDPAEAKTIHQRPAVAPGPRMETFAMGGWLKCQLSGSRRADPL